jgi:hypothetical protein
LLAATASRSRRLFRARFDPRCPALFDRGRRECRMRVAPVAACAAKKHRRQQPGVHRINRHSLHNGVTAYTRSPRGPCLFATVISGSFRSLSACIGAPGPRDFAVRESLIRRAKNCACGYRVHRIPLPTSVTTAKRPSCGNGTATNVNLIWGLREAIYFCREGWTGFCKGEVICPTGSHTTRHIATERRCEHAIQRTSKHGVATSSLRARSNPEPRGQSLS